MKKIAIIAVSGILSLVIGCFGFMFISLSDSDIEDLIVDCLYPESSYYPKGMPEYYTLNHRGNKKDLEVLRKNKGVSIILNTNKDTATMIKYAGFFLDKGHDVNMIGKDGLTALQVAVIHNQPEVAEYLLQRGADPNIVVGKLNDEDMVITGMTTKELVLKLSKKDRQDRSRILNLLQ